MRRYWVVALAVLTLLGVLSPPAFAQAPTPKVTINGLMDFLTTYDSNLSPHDRDMTRGGDTELYSRTRFRPDFSFELGAAKAVMGLEIDAGFGQSGPADTLIVAGNTPTALSGVGSAMGQSGVGLDLNTDTLLAIELKWLYLDFPFTGKGALLPFVPVPTKARVGAQPFAATYKLATLATGDFAGLNLDTTWTPTVKSHLTYVQIDENYYGTRRAEGWYGRGDDFAVIASVEVTPIKGLDLRPIYSIAVLEGHSGARTSRGGVTNDEKVFRPNDREYRHTLGIDARYKVGNFFFEPTAFWQLGDRHHQKARTAAWGTDGDTGTTQTTAGTTANVSMNAWLFDVRGGYRMGPLLLEAMYMWTSGNSARDNLNDGINYYQPITTDSGYYGGGWSAIYGLGTDYYKGFHQSAAGAGGGDNLTNNIGYNIYGRTQFGVRATYNLTPALDLRAVVTPAWTVEDVDIQRGAGQAPVSRVTSGDSWEGKENYLGTEIVAGFAWRFAPGLAFDWELGHLFSGSALDRRLLRGGVATTLDSKDATITTGRLRYTF